MKARRVFISYRREKAEDAARLVRDALRRRRFRTFMDVEDLRSGRLTDTLLQEVRACSDFVLILTPGSLDGCVKPDDWLRREVVEAMVQGKNIIPVATDDFVWPTLPENLAPLKNYQVLYVSRHLFEPSMDKLALWLRPRPVISLSPLQLGVALLVGSGVLAGVYLALRPSPAAVPATRLAGSNVAPPIPATNRPQAFAQTLRLHGPQGADDLVAITGAQLTLTVSNQRYTALVTNGCEAHFDALPAGFLGQTGLVTLAALDWQLVETTVVLPLTGQSTALAVKPVGTTFRGSVRSFGDRQPIGQAQVSLAGLATNTSAAGQFDLHVPRSKLAPLLELEVSAAGFAPYTQTVTSPRGSLEIRLHKSGPPLTAFGQTVRFFGPGGTNIPLALDGAKVELKLGAQSLGKADATRREVRFAALPLKYLGQTGAVTLTAKNWQLAKGADAVYLTGEPAWLGVEPVGIAIQGVVTSSDDARPVAQARVTLDNLATNTDAAGAFSFLLPESPVAHAPQGMIDGLKEVLSMKLEVTAAGFLTYRQAVLVRPTRLQIKLPRTPSRFVQMIFCYGPNGTNDGVALEGGSLSLRVRDQTFPATITNRFEARFADLPLNLRDQTGMVSLVAQDWQLPPATASIRLTGQTVWLALERASTLVSLKGTVRSQGDEAPLPQARVTLGAWATNTDAAGEFSFALKPELSASATKLEVTLAGYAPYRQAISPESGPLQIRLKRVAAAASAVSLNALLDQAQALETSDPKQAEASYRKALAAYPGEFKALDGLATFLRQHGRSEEAIPLATTAANLAQKPENKASLPAMLNNLGLALEGARRFDEAEARYGEAVAQYKPLLTTAPELFRPGYARCLDNRGLMRFHNNNLRPAQADLEGALQVRRDLARTGKAEPQAELALTLVHLAAVHEAAGAQDKARQILGEAIDKYREAERQDSQYGLPLAAALKQAGDLLKAAGDSKGAQKAYEESVGIYQRLKADEPACPSRDDFATALNNYAVFLAQSYDPSRAQLALGAYQRAINLYSNLAQASPVSYLPLLANSFFNLGTLYDDQMDNAVLARSAFEQALANYRALPAPQRDQFALAKARTLLNLSRATATVGDSGAQKLFKDAISAFNELVQRERSIPHLEGLAGAESACASYYGATRNTLDARLTYRNAIGHYQELAQMKSWTNQYDYAFTLREQGVFLFNCKDKAGICSDPSGAKEAYNAALRACRTCGDARLTVRVLLDLALLAVELGDYAGARERYAEALKACEPLRAKDPGDYEASLAGTHLGLADLELRDAARGNRENHINKAKAELAQASALLKRLSASPEKDKLQKKERELSRLLSQSGI